MVYNAAFAAQGQTDLTILQLSTSNNVPTYESMGNLINYERCNTSGVAVALLSEL